MGPFNGVKFQVSMVQKLFLLLEGEAGWWIRNTTASKQKTKKNTNNQAHNYDVQSF